MDLFLHLTHCATGVSGGFVPHQCGQTDVSLFIWGAGCSDGKYVWLYQHGAVLRVLELYCTRLYQLAVIMYIKCFCVGAGLCLASSKSGHTGLSCANHPSWSMVRCKRFQSTFNSSLSRPLNWILPVSFPWAWKELGVTTEDICSVNTKCEVPGAQPTRLLLTQREGGKVPSVPEMEGWAVLCVHMECDWRQCPKTGCGRLKCILQGKEWDMTLFLEVGDIFRLTFFSPGSLIFWLSKAF